MKNIDLKFLKIEAADNSSRYRMAFIKYKGYPFKMKTDFIKISKYDIVKYDQNLYVKFYLDINNETTKPFITHLKEMDEHFSRQGLIKDCFGRKQTYNYKPIIREESRFPNSISLKMKIKLNEAATTIIRNATTIIRDGKKIPITTEDDLVQNLRPNSSIKISYTYSSIIMTGHYYSVENCHYHLTLTINQIEIDTPCFQNADWKLVLDLHSIKKTYRKFMVEQKERILDCSIIEV